MEDGFWLSKEDKAKLAALKKELVALKAEHKNFAAAKSQLTADQKDQWKLNSKRTNEVYIEIKDLRFKNIMEAGK